MIGGLSSEQYGTGMEKVQFMAELEHLLKETEINTDKLSNQELTARVKQHLLKTKKLTESVTKASYFNSTERRARLDDIQTVINNLFVSLTNRDDIEISIVKADLQNLEQVVIAAKLSSMENTSGSVDQKLVVQVHTDLGTADQATNESEFDHWSVADWELEIQSISMQIDLLAEQLHSSFLSIDAILQELLDTEVFIKSAQKYLSPFLSLRPGSQKYEFKRIALTFQPVLKKFVDLVLDIQKNKQRATESKDEKLRREYKSEFDLHERLKKEIVDAGEELKSLRTQQKPSNLPDYNTRYFKIVSRVKQIASSLITQKKQIDNYVERIPLNYPTEIRNLFISLSVSVDEVIELAKIVKKETWQTEVIVQNSSLLQLREVLKNSVPVGATYTTYHSLYKKLQLVLMAAEKTVAELEKKNDTDYMITIHDLFEQGKNRLESIRVALLESLKKNYKNILSELDPQRNNSFAAIVGKLESIDLSKQNKDWLEKAKKTLTDAVQRAKSQKDNAILPEVVGMRETLEQLSNDLFSRATALDERIDQLLSDLRSETEQIEADRKKYEEDRKNLLADFSRLEGEENTGEFLKNKLETFVLRAKELRVLADNINDHRLKKDADDVMSEITARKLLLFQWQYFKARTLDTRKVSAFETVNDDNIPINGEVIDWIVNHGIAGESNDILNPRKKIEVKSMRGYGKVESIEFGQTAVGEVMRILDDYYRGKLIIKGRSGNRLAPANIQDHIGDVQEYILKQNPRFTKTIVRNAFRLHWVVTANQSYLLSEKDTPMVSDELFQVWRWLRYFIKYAKRDTDPYARDFTMFLFGMIGTRNFSEKDEKKITEKLKEAHLWDFSDKRFKTKGFGDYSWMLKPLISMRTLFETDKADEGYTIQPPLAYLTVINNGKPELLPTENGKPGRVREFLDMKTIEDRLIYELMPWLELEEGKVRGYWQDLRDGPSGFLTNYLKGDPEKLAHEVSNPAWWKNFKNKLVYTVPMLRYIGHLNGMKLAVPRGSQELVSDVNLAECVIRQIIILFLVAIVREKTKRSKKPWTQTEVDAVLLTPIEAGVIDVEDKEAIIKVAINAGELLLEQLSSTFMAQIEKSK